MNRNAAAQARQAPQDVLAGGVERITFHNAESYFCVLRVKARGHRDLVTVVGHAATILAGEWITATGELFGQCLGQCCDGKLLLPAQDGTNSARDVSHKGTSQGRCVRLH
jgi:hypothetical protein